MFHCAIAGTGHAVPSQIVTNNDLAQLVDTSDEWITTRTGIKERRRAQEGDVLSDFCVTAAKQALEAGGLSAKELDTIIVVTCTPDQPIPAMACFVQAKLGAKGAAAWDTNAA